MLRGANTLAKCSSDYVVQYFDHWIENNDCLYIQKELCSDNLKNIIQQKQLFFRNNSSELMKPIEYFISCQLFEEVLECVIYLHGSNIMHRDLKPENILIFRNSDNYLSVKICDFDLDEFAGLSDGNHSKKIGGNKYIAPEVKEKTIYQINCDVYSLGVIALELFDFGNFE